MTDTEDRDEDAVWLVYHGRPLPDSLEAVVNDANPTRRERLHAARAVIAGLARAVEREHNTGSGYLVVPSSHDWYTGRRIGVRAVRRTIDDLRDRGWIRRIPATANHFPRFKAAGLLRNVVLGALEPVPVLGAGVARLPGNIAPQREPIQLRDPDKKLVGEDGAERWGVAPGDAPTYWCRAEHEVRTINRGLRSLLGRLLLPVEGSHEWLTSPGRRAAAISALLHVPHVTDESGDVVALDLTGAFSFQRVYNQLEHGGPLYTGRLYSGALSAIPRVVRARLRFVDAGGTVEPAVEVDFKNAHPRILAARDGHRVEGDVYELPGFDREHVKAGVNVLLNVLPEKRPGHAYGAHVTRTGGPPFRAFATALAESPHHWLATYFATGAGHLCMAVESEIAVAVVLRALDEQIRVIPNHDGFVCARSHADRVAVLAAEESNRLLGTPLPVEIKDPAEAGTAAEAVPADPRVTLLPVMPARNPASREQPHGLPPGKPQATTINRSFRAIVTVLPSSRQVREAVEAVTEGAAPHLGVHAQEHGGARVPHDRLRHRDGDAGTCGPGREAVA